MPPRKSPTAAIELGISYHQLINLLRYRKITPPQKDTSGDYLWSDDDLAAARLALMLSERRRSIMPSQEPVAALGA